MKKILLILIFITTFSVASQSLKIDDKNFRWEANLCAGLNNDGYQFDFGIAYFPVQYLGIKSTIGFAGEIEEIGDWGKDEWETGHHYAIRFKFIPSAVLRSPRIINWKSQNAGFYLYAEPGVILSPGASGSQNAKWFNWDFKGGINLQLERGIIFVGYGISNYSLYSGWPENHQGLPDKDNYITHSVIIGTAYKF